MFTFLAARTYFGDLIPHSHSIQLAKNVQNFCTADLLGQRNTMLRRTVTRPQAVNEARTVGWNSLYCKPMLVWEWATNAGNLVKFYRSSDPVPEI